MSQYIVTTPGNPNFSGKVAGVRFEKGRAFVSEFTIDPALGRNVDEVAMLLLKDFGYTVVLAEEKPAPEIQYVYAEPPATVEPVDETPAKVTRGARGGNKKS